MKSLKVLLPPPVLLVAVCVPRDHQRLLKVRPPPANATVPPVVVSVILMVEVPALKVRPVVVAVFQAVVFPAVRVHVPEPIVIERVLLLLLANAPTERFLLFAVNVPAVIVNVLAGSIVRLSARDTVEPVVFTVIFLPIETPFVVMVWVPTDPLKVMVVAPLATVMPDPSVRLPVRLMSLLERDPLNPVKLKSLQATPACVKAPVPPVTLITLNTVETARATVLDEEDVSVNASVLVPALKVRLVTVDMVKTAPVPVMVHVPEPILSVLVAVPVPLNVCIVGLLLCAEKSIVPV